MCLYMDFLFIKCFYKDLLPYLFIFKSVEFCLCSSLSRSYIFEPIGLPRLRHVLDSFANCSIRTSTRARIFENLDI